MDMAFSPRVVGRHRPDFHSLEAFLNSPQFAGKQGEDLVMAVYNHLTSQVDGTYHFWPSSENEGQPRLRRANADPIKILNGYGWAICGQMAHMLYAIWTTAGLKARLYGLPGHALCEVGYDGRWRHFDVDMWSWFRTSEGHVASAFELACNAHALIVQNQDKSNPCNLPDRDLEGYANMYSRADKGESDINSVRPDWACRGHNMDFCLRPGEAIVRTEENQGRFIMPEAWRQFREKFGKEWHGTPRERYEPHRTFGNGRWIYQPDLSSASRDFELGAWDSQGVRQDADGLVGAGSATFRMQSPYPFAGVPDWKGEKITSSSGVWLEVAGEGVRVEITDPEGQWQTVYTCDKPFDERLDMTEMLKARYECLIRLTLGEGGRLSRFRFEGFFMVAPITLPRLVEGENPMEVRCCDKHGQQTVPWTRMIDLRPGADVASQWVSAENEKIEPYAEGWQSVAPADAGKPVRAVFRFDAPQGRKFGWAYILTTHREGPADQPAGQAMIEWSVDGKNWTPLADRRICNTPAGWDCSLDGEVLTPDGAATIWLRVTSDTGISAVEFYGHLQVPAAAELPLEITHMWKEGGAVREFRVPAGQTSYTVTCGEKPYAHAIRMGMASVKKG